MDSIIATLGALLAAVLLYLLARLRHARFSQFAHLPMPPPSLLWGHLGLMVKIIRRDPSRHYHYGVHELIKNSPGEKGLLLLDIRPIFQPLLMITSHELVEQVTKASPHFKYSVPKAPLQEVLGPVTGHKSFLMANGEQWRETRKLFNTAFAPSHVATFTSQIIDKTRLFLDGLDGYAESGEEFSLGERCTLLTLDVIGRAVLDIDFNSQGDPSEQHEVARCFQELLKNLPFLTQIEWIVSPRKYRRRMAITKRIETSLRNTVQEKFNRVRDKAETADKSVLSLSMEDIDSLSPDAMQERIDSIRTFLFAGYDTTAVLLQWALYELSRTPRALTALRQELDNILGNDASPSAMKNALLADENKLNQLPYLSAVIKETLRLHSPAGSSRLVPPGTDFRLQTASGPVCVDGAILYLNHFSLHRDPAVYGESADAWVPERWLENPAVPATAWRPFERGPRNCIGRELAYLEAKIALVMTARRFDFVKIGVGAVTAVVDEYGQYRSDCPLYDTFNMSSKPVDGTQMTVKFHRR